MDDIAQALGLDPVELRLKNCMRLGYVDPGTGITCHSTGLEACIRQGQQAIGWEEKRRAYDRQRAAGTGTGKGAFAWEGNRERKETKKSEEDGRGTPLSGEEQFARFFGFRPGTGMETYQGQKAGQKKPGGPAKPEEMFAFFFGHR